MTPVALETGGTRLAESITDVAGEDNKSWRSRSDVSIKRGGPLPSAGRPQEASAPRTELTALHITQLSFAATSIKSSSPAPVEFSRALSEDQRKSRGFADPLGLEVPLHASFTQLSVRNAG